MQDRCVVERGRQPSLLTDEDLWLFNEGNHSSLYEVLGAHPIRWRGQVGTYFAVWAPDAEAVSVVGDFNAWEPGREPLRPRGESGIWEGFVRGVGPGALYKYHIVSRYGWQGFKADPFSFYMEMPPKTASIVWDLSYAWCDEAWMRVRGTR
ncbi:MAG: 1,4-alpha-glucan branching enzyme, partial [Candidatus Bipolaricaulota bacterium]|nr:1,4-alpha-glucan branching enzyme [Candidatus Bipolaricaulota bacterium]MDW8127275.1 1,4-alpha-glucan branching enzyme [Candidatus Bipolaricaulota bacterium]